MTGKKAISGVVITVLLIFLAIVVGTMIFYSSRLFLEKTQKDSAVTMAKNQCAERFNIELQACYSLGTGTASDTIKVDLINLKEKIPAGSSVSLESDQSRVLIPITDLNSQVQEIMQGEGRSLVLTIPNSVLDLDTFGLKKVKFIPIFINNNQRVLCDELPEVDAKLC